MPSCGLEPSIPCDPIYVRNERIRPLDHHGRHFFGVVMNKDPSKQWSDFFRIFVQYLISTIFRTTDLHSLIAQHSDPHCMITFILIPTSSLSLMKIRKRLLLNLSLFLLNSNKGAWKCEKRKEEDLIECFWVNLFLVNVDDIIQSVICGWVGVIVSLFAPSPPVPPLFLALSNLISIHG